MWMAELSARTGLPVPTIKFYLREGLLPAGEATGATRAKYDDRHVRRLTLIRALTDVAGLRLDAVRQVLEGIEEAQGWHQAVGSAHTQLSRPDDRPPSPAALDKVDRLLARQSWRLPSASAHRVVLAQALDALASLGHDVSDPLLDVYARAMRDVARAEVATMSEDPMAAAEHAVVGTVLVEPVLLALRRVAQENESRTGPGGATR